MARLSEGESVVLEKTNMFFVCVVTRGSVFLFVEMR